MGSWVIRRVKDGLYYGGSPSAWNPLHEDTTRWNSRSHERDLVSALGEGEEWVELDDAGRPVEAKPAPVRAWVVRRVPEGDFWSGSLGKWTTNLSEARTYSTAEWVNPGHRENVPVLVHHDGTVTLDEPAPAVAQGANAGPVVGWVLTDGKGFYERGTGNFVRDLERAAAYPCKQEVWSSGQASVPFGHRDDGSRFLLPTAPAVAQPSPYSEDEPIPYKLADDDDVQVVASTSERLGVLYAELTRMTAEVAQLERQRDEAAARLRGGK